MQEGSVEGFRLSPQQNRLWSLQRSSLAYRSQCALLIEGAIEHDALREAVGSVIRRHEILRTAFHRPPGLKFPFQIINESGLPNWQTVALGDCQAQERESRIAEIFRREGLRPFDLTRSSLLRLSLLTLSPDRHVLLIGLPSLCADARTLRNLVNEIGRSYTAASPGVVTADEPVQYADFSEWANELLESEEAAEGKRFWRRHELSALAAWALPFETEPSKPSVFEPECSTFVIDPEQAQRFDWPTGGDGVTTEVFLLACWQTLLWRLTGRAEIIVGKACDGRKQEEFKEALGLFARWVPVRAHFTESLRFDEVLKRVAQSAGDSSRRQEYFTWETEDSSSNGMREPAFFPVCFEHEESAAKYLADGLSFSIGRQYTCFERFKLKLRCVRRDDVTALEFHYDPALFTPDAIDCLKAQFASLVQSARERPDAGLAQLELLDESGRRRLAGFNSTRREYSLDHCAHELFEHQAQATPERAALVFEQEQLSYRELNARANQLAHHLRALGVGPETPVAICLDRSPDVIVGILGAWKAGGAYVPLEAAQPKERLRRMLEDTRAAVVLTHERLLEFLPDVGAHVLCLDRDWKEVSAQSRENPQGLASSENLAYVIFTSGSTGRPKGVAVEHRQLVNYLKGIAERLELRDGAGYAVVSTFAADLGHTMIFPALCLGGCLHVVSQERATDPAALADYFSRHEMDYLKIVPTHLKALLTCEEPERILPRRLVLGGEASGWELIERLREIAPQCEVHNHYGPTETTVGVTTYCPEAGHKPKRTASVPLGRPLANSELYLLDGDEQLTATGLVGELHIGGAGVARGYINLPELTAERFTPDPFSGRAGARLYKSGDLARYWPDGRIEFAGRVDNQIKFHGHRVELDEIRAALNKHPSIEDSVVTATNDDKGNAVLAAYYAADRALEGPALREFLSQSIIAETLPNFFIHLRALPLTSNGKVNREALPSLDEARAQTERTFAAPCSETEQVLARIWSEVLRVERVGIHDNFFTLGGDSILVIQVVGRAGQEGLRFTPNQFFQHQTIAELATVAVQTRSVHAEQGAVTGEIPLTPIQRWFFEKELAEPHHWNQAMMIELRRPLDSSLLEEALRALTAHHDGLRLRFVLDAGDWRQHNAEREDAVIFSSLDLSTLDEERQEAAVPERLDELQSGLDLRHGPLLRACLFDLGPHKAGRLLIIIHHLAVDGVSWRILLEDLEIVYRQLSQTRPVQLPPKTTSFKYWAAKLSEYAASDALKQETAYWLPAAAPESARLPVDYPGGDNTEASARHLTLVLGAEETRVLLHDVATAYRTQLNVLLLAALVESFSPWTLTRSLLIDMEGHGREEISEGVDVSRTVGWFTTHFPLRVDLGGASRPGDALKSVKEQLRAVPQHGIGYGLLRYAAPKGACTEKLRSAARPEVSFNYMGQFDQVLHDSQLFATTLYETRSARSPVARRGHLLEINSGVIGGELHVVWTYSERLHQRSTVERLADAFRAALRSIAAHCLTPEAEDYSLSDFPLAELNEQELSKLSRLLDKLDSA
jgi:amino acid adenylation domain-containing protein/non-ribosomal peptide synthase protein (TIGR01720 family)